MSGNLSQSGSDLYAVVDLSKKKKIKSSGVTDSQRSEPDISMYAVVERESPLLSQKEEQKYDNQRNNPSFKQNLDSDGTNGNLTPSRLKRFISIMLAIAAFVVFVVVIAMIIMIFIKLAALEAANSSYHEYVKSNLSSLQTGKEDITNEVDQINKTLQEFFQNELQNIQQTIDNFGTDTPNTLSFDGRLDSLNDSYGSLESELNDLSSSLNTLSHEVQRNSLGALRYYPPSCSAILQLNLSSSTGNYIVRSSTGLLRSAYCDMTRTCGGITGGWMRVANLDLNHCPQGLKSMSFNNIQTCVVYNDAAGCTSLDFSTFDFHYTKVCGQIRAYQVGTPDGFTSVTSNQHTMNINDNYLDGISITSNRQHVWSFAAGRCDCNNNPPPFIDGDWACGGDDECQTATLCKPLLWSSQTCGEAMSPYFFKNLVNTTTDVEVRFCRDQVRQDEDLAIKTLELHVQ